MDDDEYLNHGLAEGIAYRGRILVSLKVEICDKMDHDGYKVSICISLHNSVHPSPP